MRMKKKMERETHFYDDDCLTDLLATNYPVSIGRGGSESFCTQFPGLSSSFAFRHRFRKRDWKMAKSDQELNSAVISNRRIDMKSRFR
jgi:hypothetical protein